MTVDERLRVLRTTVGTRENRRHRPGRAFEHATYAFDVLTDYGAFRDLQRHRMLTIDWQDLTVRHGCVRPADVDAVGAPRRLGPRHGTTRPSCTNARRVPVRRWSPSTPCRWPIAPASICG